MKLDDLIKGKTEWLRGEGPNSNIAISTRVRLARNVAGHIYFDHADEKHRQETLETVLKAMKKSKFLKTAAFLNVKDLSEVDRLFLVERHLMSRDHMKEFEQKAIVLEEKEIVSAMINEEDHLRLQVLKSGFNVMEAWRIADEIDNELAMQMTFDYSNKFGFLTSCPTNTGTGLRVSVMLHLSALALTGQIFGVFEAISKVGMTMRGFYGEGTEALGDFFQISNQVSLGHSEMDIIGNLQRVVRKIIATEELAREKILKSKKEEISDRVSRSLVTLKSTRIITSSETIKLLSAIRFGSDMGLVYELETSTINEMLLLTQPAHLQKINGKKIAAHERDMKRADLIRERLGVEDK